MAEESAGEFDARYNPGHETIRVEAVTEEHESVLEPFLWALFSLGGFLTAFLLPVTIVAISFLVPVGFWPATRIDYAWFQSAINPAAANFQGLIVRAFLFLVIAGGFVHGAHRFTYMVGEATHHKGERAVSALCHGLAIIGSLVALYYVLLGWLL